MNSNLTVCIQREKFSRVSLHVFMKVSCRARTCSGIFNEVWFRYWCHL